MYLEFNEIKFKFSYINWLMKYLHMHREDNHVH